MVQKIVSKQILGENKELIGQIPLLINNDEDVVSTERIVKILNNEFEDNRGIAKEHPNSKINYVFQYIRYD